MVKEGDRLKCKSLPKMVNFIERDSDPNITVGEYYTVLSVGWNGKNHSTTNPDGLYMLHMQGNRGPCDYWSDYFYGTTELRRLKLNKIINGIQSR